MQAVFAGAVGQRFHAAVVQITTAVEHSAFDSDRLCAGGDEPTYFRSLFGRSGRQQVGSR
jgi:hypothetical protein